jgi:predicted DNA-binding protein (MmcQ/YjbR family)
MTIETVRQICLGFPGVTEDVKWGNDLVFSVARKMFAALDVEPPHSLAFKCSPESFAELVEREGIIPAPYLARALWAQEQELGHSLDRRELERLLREAYDIVVARLPASKRPGTSSSKATRVIRPRKSKRKGGPKAGRR